MNSSRITSILILLILSLPGLSNSQVRMDRFYGSDTLFSHFTDVSIADNQDIVVCGFASSPSENSQALILRTDAAGNVVWANKYANPGMTELKSIYQASDGGYYAAGMVDTTTGWGNEDGFIMKIDPDGNLEWWTAVGGLTFEHLNYVMETDSGYVVATGTFVDGAGDDRFWFVKMDSLGSLIQSFVYFPETVAEGFVAKPYPGGGYVIGGIGTVDAVNQAVLFKISDAGVLEWYYGYGQPSGSEEIHDLIILDDTSIVFTGTCFKSNRQAFIGKTDKLGSREWLHYFSGPENDNSWEVMEHPSGGFIMAGYTEGLGTGPYKGPMLIKTSPEGFAEWSRIYHNDFAMERIGMAYSPSDEIVLATTHLPTPGNAYGNILRADSSGIHCDYNDGSFMPLMIMLRNDTPVVSASTGSYFTYPLSPEITEWSQPDSTSCTECDTVVAGFSFDPEGLSVGFRSESENAISYEWDFGDGTTSTAQNPIHTYTLSNTYTVCLIVDNGCSKDTLCQDIMAVGVEGPLITFPMKIFPNPASDIVNLEWDAGTGSKGTFLILNAAGQLVYQDHITSTVGSVSLPVASLPEGIYRIRMEIGGKWSTGTFVKF